MSSSTITPAYSSSTAPRSPSGSPRGPPPRLARRLALHRPRRVYGSLEIAHAAKASASTRHRRGAHPHRRAHVTVLVGTRGLRRPPPRCSPTRTPAPGGRRLIPPTLPLDTLCRGPTDSSASPAVPAHGLGARSQRARPRRRRVRRITSTSSSSAPYGAATPADAALRGSPATPASPPSPPATSTPTTTARGLQDALVTIRCRTSLATAAGAAGQPRGHPSRRRR